VSVGAVGWLASVRWGAGVTAPAVARLVGRENRKRILLVGLGCFAAGAIVTTVAGVYAGAVVGFALMGLGKPLFDSGTQAWVADTVPYRRRARVLGVLETTWALSFLVGAPLAGWMIERSGWSAPLWLAACLAVVVAVPVARASLDAGAGSASETLRIRGDAAVLSFLVATALIVGSAEMVFVTFAAWLERTHGFGIVELAAVATAIGTAELAAEGAVVAFTDRIGKRRAVALGLGMAAIGFGALWPLGSNLPLALTGLVVGITGFEFAFVSSISVGTELRPGARIQVLTRFVVAQALGRAVAAIAAVAIAEAVGFGVVGVVSATAAIVAGWIVMTRVREVSDVQRPTT
jgi:DHA1 family inner membrane transport protein